MSTHPPTLSCGAWSTLPLPEESAVAMSVRMSSKATLEGFKGELDEHLFQRRLFTVSTSLAGYGIWSIRPIPNNKTSQRT